MAPEARAPAGKAAAGPLLCCEQARPRTTCCAGLGGGGPGLRIRRPGDRIRRPRGLIYAMRRRLPPPRRACAGARHGGGDGSFHHAGASVVVRGRLRVVAGGRIRRPGPGGTLWGSPTPLSGGSGIPTRGCPSWARRRVPWWPVATSAAVAAAARDGGSGGRGRMVLRRLGDEGFARRKSCSASGRAGSDDVHWTPCSPLGALSR